MKLQFGQYSIDVGRQELSDAEGLVELEPQVFTLIAYLADNAERVVSKDELIEHVWEGRVVSDANLNTRINAARRAVGDDGKAQSVIKTYPRRGFRFVAEIGGQPDVMKVAQFRGKSKVSVMPFRNQSNDAELDHFCEALTEDLIAELCQVSQLTVASRTSEYATNHSDSAGQALSVKYLVEAGVRQMGRKIRISTTLINTSQDSVIWSDHFIVNNEDTFEAEEEAIQNIAVDLIPTILRTERQHALDMTDPGAWEYYLRGWGRLHDHGFVGAIDEAELAIKDFKLAIELDPKLADAHAGVARASWVTAAFWNLPNRLELQEQALKYAKQSVLLNNFDCSTVTTLGIVLAHSGQIEEGMAVLKRAVTLAPNNVEARLHIGLSYVFKGQISHSIDELKWVWEQGRLHPYHGAAAAWLAMALVFDNRAVEAEHFAQEAVANPRTQFWANVSLILSLIGQDKQQEAVVARKALQDFRPELTCKIVKILLPVAAPEFVQLTYDRLRASGLPD